MLLLNILKANRWSYYPSPLGWDCIGAVFTLTGFMLALFSLISNGPGLQSVYFLKLIENPPTDLQITFGLYHYCIQDECIQDKSIMIVPFDERVIDLLNYTYPQLFQNPNLVEEVEETRPPHNPHMYSALILLLIFAGTSLFMNLYKISQQRHLHGYRDRYFSRGFTVLISCIFALLLVTLIACTYQEAAYQLLKYPGLVVTLGPSVPMIGCSFMCLFLASAVLLMGCTTRLDTYSHIA